MATKIPNCSSALDLTKNEFNLKIELTNLTKYP